MLKKFDSIPDDIKKKCIDEVITRIEDIDSEQVGIIAAEDVIDIILENYGPHIYNMALNDTKKLLETKVADIEVEIDALQQS